VRRWPAAFNLARIELNVCWVCPGFDATFPTALAWPQRPRARARTRVIRRTAAAPTGTRAHAGDTSHDPAAAARRPPPPAMAPSSSSLVVQAIIFTLTGVLSTIVGQLLIFAGAGDAWTMLLPLSNYAGMAAAGIFFPPPPRPSSKALTTSATTSLSAPSAADELEASSSVAVVSADSTDGGGGGAGGSGVVAGAASSSSSSGGSAAAASLHHRSAARRGGGAAAGGAGAGGSGAVSSVQSGAASPASTPARGAGGSGSGSDSHLLLLSSGGGGGGPGGGAISSSQSAASSSSSSVLASAAHTLSIIPVAAAAMSDAGDGGGSSDEEGGGGVDGAAAEGGGGGGEEGGGGERRRRRPPPSARTQLTRATRSFFRSLKSRLQMLADGAGVPAAAGGAGVAGASSSSSSSASSPIASTASSQSLLLSPSSSSSSSSSSAGGGAGGAIGGGPTISLRTYVMAACVLDIVGFSLHVMGMKYAGSALFQILYSSVVVWAALGARIVRGPKAAGLNVPQALGIAVALAGLAYSTLAERSHGGVAAAVHQHAPPPPEGGEAAVAASHHHSPSAPSPLLVPLGIAASLASAMTYGAVYVLAEVLMAGPSAPESGQVATRVGLGISTILSVWVAVYTLPNFSAVLARVAEEDLLSWPAILLCYITMAGSAVLHSISYYELMGTLGGVGAGLLQAARAVGVFVVAGFLFCDRQESQCYTRARAIATVLVVGGVLVYSYGKQEKKKEEARVAAASAAGAAGE
jgi:hypothetical protein